MPRDGAKDVVHLSARHRKTIQGPRLAAAGHVWRGSLPRGFEATTARLFSDVLERNVESAINNRTFREDISSQALADVWVKAHSALRKAARAAVTKTELQADTQGPLGIETDIPRTRYLDSLGAPRDRSGRRPLRPDPPGSPV
jgi:hypothetical protein